MTQEQFEGVSRIIGLVMQGAFAAACLLFVVVVFALAARPTIR